MEIAGFPSPHMSAYAGSAAENNDSQASPLNNDPDQVSITGAQGVRLFNAAQFAGLRPSISSLLDIGEKCAVDETKRETYSIRTRTAQEENALYDLRASYPQLESCPDEALKKGFNAWVGSLASTRMDEFKKYATETRDVAGMKNSFDLSYEIASETGRFVSVSFMTFEYYAGAAHPSHNITTFTYDLEKNKEITFSDLFAGTRKDLFEKGEAPVNVISDYCIKDLKRQAQMNGMDPDPFIDTGAGPREENFRNFNLTKDALIIHFNEYQAGCYAEGPKEVRIPYDDIRDMINPDGPLGELSPRRLPDGKPEAAPKKCIEESGNVIIIDGVRLEKRA